MEYDANNISESDRDGTIDDVDLSVYLVLDRRARIRLEGLEQFATLRGLRSMLKRHPHHFFAIMRSYNEPAGMLWDATSLFADEAALTHIVGYPDAHTAFNALGTIRDYSPAIMQRWFDASQRHDAHPLKDTE